MDKRFVLPLLSAVISAAALTACQTPETGARGRSGDTYQGTTGVEGRQGTEAGGGYTRPEDLQSPSGTSDDTSGARGRAGEPDDSLPGARGSSTTNPDSSDRVPEQGRDWGGRY